MDSDNFSPFKIRVSQVIGLAKLIVSKAEIDTLIANAVTASEANIEKLIVKKAEIEELIVKKLETLVLKLPESKVGEEETSRISWLDSEGIVQEQILGRFLTPESLLVIQAGATLLLQRRKAAEVVIKAISSVNSGGAQMSFRTLENAAADITARAGTITRTLLNEEQASHFLQIASTLAVKRVRNRGSGKVTFPGGANTSSELVVEHGLKETPVDVNIQPCDPFPGDFTVPYITSKTATTFGVKLQTRSGALPAAGTQGGFTWSAET